MTSQSRKSGNPTVQDVAREANVSSATVSRALSEPDRVSEKMRERVAAAVAKTGYVINHAARNLRRRDTGTIVALIPNIGNSHFSNVLQGIETVCAEKNLKVLIADTRKPSMSRQNYYDFFSRANCDGIISLDDRFSMADMRKSNNDLPHVVTAGEWCDDPDVPIAVVDNLLGADMVMQHLLQLGHRQFGHITGSLYHRPGTDRKKGFEDALNRAGLDANSAWITKGDYSFDCGEHAAKEFLALEKRPTAVFCASDHTAIGFIATLNKAGVRVPEDVSVVGFDDLEIAKHYIPSLTTVYQPRRIVGEKAARLMLSLLEGNVPQTIHEQIEPWLEVRASTAPPK